jgi:hypothetical protein
VRKRINGKEVMAWIILVCAVILFSFSMAVAQDKKSAEKSTVHIKIEKNENGKVTKIDTIVSKDQLPQLKEYLKKSGIDLETEEGDENVTRAYSFSDSDSDSKEDRKVIIRNKSKMTPEQRAKFEKEMEKFHESMAKMKEEMKDIHIEINGEGLDENFNFNMQVPSPPGAPQVYMYEFKDEDDREDGDKKKSKHRAYNYSYFMNSDVPDSLKDGNHFIIRGKKGEEKPVLEKEITGKNGEKIFVFKRKLPKEETVASAKSSLGISRVKVYPNPGNGNASVSFTAKSKGDLSISITDIKGKEVYSETKKDFSGEFFNQVDLSAKAKGAYFVKITQGDDSVIKKIIVE